VALAADDEETGGALGLTVANVTPELVERYSLESEQGILITKIDPEGPAAEANLRVGDLVVEADGKEVGSVKEFEELVGKMKSGKVLRLLIQRRATLLYTTVTLE
jgi:serine protease Do